MQSPPRARGEMPERGTYSLREFSELLGINYYSARKLAEGGELPVDAMRVGRQYLFPKATVDRLLELTDAKKDAA